MHSGGLNKDDSIQDDIRAGDLSGSARVGPERLYDGYGDLLRQKIKADKKLVVAQNLKLTDAEGAKFWPVYDAYQKDLQQINERLAATILRYSDAYDKGPVTDEKAKQLLDEYSSRSMTPRRS